MEEHSYPYRNRLERRRELDAYRKRRRRRNLFIATAVLLAIACTGALVWLGYRLVIAGRKPAKPATYRVIIPEGLTIKGTAEKVASQSPVSEEAFERAANAGGYRYVFLAEAGGNLEGYLFPKTYEATDRTTARDIVNMMLEQFGEETESFDWSQAKKNNLTRQQVMIIASLVEREAKLPEERAVIASIICNRLKAGMKLQLCSTVQYSLGEWKESLSYEDLEIDSPYNTYKITGLPPGPICNPGFESIRAALYPADTDYLYFILTGEEGSHSFTSDYQQFLRWKEEQEGVR